MLANQNPDSILAARNPVVLRSKVSFIEAQKVQISPDLINGRNKSDEYLLPEYNITINNAYKDFNYSISVIVDQNGNMQFRRFLNAVMPEFEESKTRIVKALIEGYLKPYLDIKSGSTLGFPHSSSVKLNMIGRKG